MISRTKITQTITRFKKIIQKRIYSYIAVSYVYIKSCVFKEVKSNNIFIQESEN